MKALLEIGPKGPSLRMMSESLSAWVAGVVIVGLLSGPACAASVRGSRAGVRRSLLDDWVGVVKGCVDRRHFAPVD